MKRILFVFLIPAMLAMICSPALAMPRPSWDFAAIESMPKPDDPAAFEQEQRYAYQNVLSTDQSELLSPIAGYATLWAPIVARAWLFRYTENNLLTEEQFAQQWAEQKKTLSKYLTFQLYLHADEYEYAIIDGPLSKITNVVLIDDTGRRFAPISKFSGDPKIETSGGKLVYSAYNAVNFPLTDSSGKPIITPTIKYLDLYVTSAQGKTKFRFEFDE